MTGDLGDQSTGFSTWGSSTAISHWEEGGQTGSLQLGTHLGRPALEIVSSQW